ncbi:MAG: hypothetical protein IJD42_07850 [Clostridia bacterium]|nr:hypothetical protein [Clostridia bacterium]
MKPSIFGKIIALLMLLFAVIIVAGCAKSKPENNIQLEVIPNENDYSITDNTKRYATDAVFSLLCKYQEKKTGTLGNEAKVKAEKQANSIIQNGEFNLREEQYKKSFDIIEKRQNEIADGIISIMDGNLENGVKELKSAYTELNSLSSTSALSEIVYQLALCEFDMRYEKQMAAYDRLGTPYLLEKADEYKRGKEIFISDVGSKNIDLLIKHTLACAELFYGGAFESGFINSFSNDEILVFLKELQLDKITVTDTGWTLLLTAYGEASIKNVSKSFINRVLFSASQNGDSKEFAHSMKELISLASIAQQRMTADDIEYLRNGDENGFLLSILSNFDENDWLAFDNAMPKNIKSDTYISHAKTKYGADFEAYLESYKVSTLEELKASQGTPDFYKTLKEYIAGICPAFSYGLME